MTFPHRLCRHRSSVNLLSLTRYHQQPNCCRYSQSSTVPTRQTKEFMSPRTRHNPYIQPPGLPENISNYAVGWFLAVHLGDVFHNGRYKIIHRLKSSGTSQLWLAKDQSTGGHGYVSLKIVQKSRSELRILSRTSHRSQNHPGSKHIPKLLDSFEISRSGSLYDALVMEVPGAHVKTVLDNSPIPSNFLRARTICKQLALGLAHLHECNVICGNLKVLDARYTAQDHRGLGEHEILDLLGQPKTIPVRRHDGKRLSPLIPHYTVIPTEFPDSEGEIRISSLSKAFLFEEKPQHINLPHHQQAPEIVFAKNPSEWDYRIDLWWLGATICSAFTARTPYLWRGSSDGESKWRMTRAMFKRPQLESVFTNDTNKYHVNNCHGVRPLEESIRLAHDVLGGGMSEKELSGLIDIVRSLMVVDPKGRKSAMEIAEHPFLNPP